MLLSTSRKLIVVLLLGLTILHACAQSPQGDKVDTAKANEPNTTRVLFLGNSYTFMWDVPGLFQKMAADAPTKKKVFVHGLTWGGQSLNFYWSQIEKKADTGNFERLLDAVKWDYVVLQRWDKDDVKEVVPKFADLIHAKNLSTQVLLYAWLSDDPKNKGVTPEWVQDEHLQACEKTGAIVLPVAWAWDRLKKEKPEVKAVAADGWHPGYVRAYMTAAILYATVFHETPVGLPVREWSVWAPPEAGGKGKVSNEEARYLQQYAWDAVTQYSNDPVFVEKRSTR